MISFWEKFVIFREKAETPQDRIYEHIFTKLDIMCEVCFTPFQTNQEIVKHIRSTHGDIIDGSRNYNMTGVEKKKATIWQHQLLFRSPICPLGCGYWRKIQGPFGKPHHEDLSDMRRHLILYHSHKQLKMWGVNR